MNNLLNMLLAFKELFIIGLVAGVVFFVIFFRLTENITWKSRNTRIFGIFMGLNVREMLWLSVGAARILFVVCVCLFAHRLDLEYTAFYVALFLLSALTFFGFPRVLIELVNAAVVYASLTALIILIGYFRDINNDPMVFVIYILLSVFTLLYSIYFYMKGIFDMTKEKLGTEEWKAAKR